MTRLLYLETSIWGRLDDPATSERRRTTDAFVRAVQAHDRIAVSPAVFAELAQTPGGDKAKWIARRIWAARPILLTPEPRVHKIAVDLLAAGRWRGNRLVDMVHVAYTVIAGADALVTWDEGDLARDRTRVVVQAYTQGRGLRAPLIGTPEEVSRWLGIRTA
jgi:predicted nucleic acid-binding protein